MTAPGKKTARTGAEVRQIIAVDTIDKQRSLLAAEIRLGDDDQQVEQAMAAYLRGESLTYFPDGMVREAIQLIDATLLPGWIDQRIKQGKKKAGRPGRVSTRAIMVGMFLATLSKGGTLVSATRDVLYHQMSAAMQAELGIAPFVRSSFNRVNVTRNRAAYAATWRAFHRMVHAIDPTIHRKGRKRTWEELEATKRNLDPAEQASLLAALDAFSTRLLAATHTLLPASVRTGYDGSACVDGTVVPSFARGRAKDDIYASTDPDAAYHTREGDHGEDATGNLIQTFGFEATMVVASDVSHAGRMYMPSFLLAVALARPGVDPSGQTRRALAALAEAGHKPGYFTGDGLYTDQKPEK